jgi:hypothetical protein
VARGACSRLGPPNHYQHWCRDSRPASLADDLPPLAVLPDLLPQVGLPRLRHEVLGPTPAAGDDLQLDGRLRSWFGPDDEITSLLGGLRVATLPTSSPCRPGELAHRLLAPPRWPLGHRHRRAARRAPNTHRARPPGVCPARTRPDRHRPRDLVIRPFCPLAPAPRRASRPTLVPLALRVDRPRPDQHLDRKCFPNSLLDGSPQGDDLRAAELVAKFSQVTGHPAIR